MSTPRPQLLSKHRVSKHHALQCLANARGQMAIFVALIFQVLFVLFAMAINVGLLIHDKINLQNAVDLGAYYGAQKMAEVMNAMAHINYQMRQDNKLLVYRMRSIGSIGFDRHPRRTNYDPSMGDVLNDDPAVREQAPICIAIPQWSQVRLSGGAVPPNTNTNLCKRVDFTLTKVPLMPVVAPFIPGVLATAEMARRTRDFITSECRGKSELNWKYAAFAYYSYLKMIIHRKEAMLALARNLSIPEDEMLDMDGGLIIDGVRKTVLNNLTFANRESLQGDENGVIMFNSLKPEVSGDRPPWLSERLIFPLLTYVDHGDTGEQCVSNVRFIRDPPQAVLDANVENTEIYQMATQLSNNPNQSPSLGFEKNPWIMGYIGVKAISAPRKPFAPFGNSIRLVARSFAKPFGGTIGPWHKKTWAPGGTNAFVGSGDGFGEIDPLTVPRAQSPSQAFQTANGDARFYIPNLAKYPGDEMGAKSNLAMHYLPGFGNGSVGFFSLGDFQHFGELSSPNADPLAFNPDPAFARGTPIYGGYPRQMEIQAAAPDLFDITYYSIDADYQRNYGSRGIWTRLRSTRGAQLVVPTDMGSHPGDDQYVTVASQVELVNRQGQRGPYFFKVADAQHLLTSWAQKSESDFSFDTRRFGRCFKAPAAGYPPTSGNCISGGRTGFSVKLVSRHYLNFDGHAIGGEGGASSGILNPPPEEF